MDKKRPPFLVNFVVRAIVGMGIIFFVNQFLDYRNIPVSVGLNIISFLTTGTLGVPGVCLLYGVMFYQLM
ncbi:MAG: Pro-sigmaK processing inhibitor BofA [Coprococcus sp.]|nr:Pro-sigmaK processing inhibitor BofA [Coprococcus sp.]